MEVDVVNRLTALLGMAVVMVAIAAAMLAGAASAAADTSSASDSDGTKTSEIKARVHSQVGTRYERHLQCRQLPQAESGIRRGRAKPTEQEPSPSRPARRPPRMTATAPQVMRTPAGRFRRPVSADKTGG